MATLVRGYLARGLALIRSLRRNVPDAVVWVLCLSRQVEEMLEAKKSAAEIGVKLNRREEAVYARVQRLRLKGKLPQEGLSFSRRSAAQIVADFLSVG